MRRILYILLFIPLWLNAEVFYVATTGSNGNPGTISQPWLTWEYAFANASPGDTIYFRGGVYPSTTGATGIRSINSGTVTDTIKYFAYPGEEPILDCNNVTSAISNLNHAIYASVSYVHFRGLTIRNVWMFDTDDEPFAWRLGGSHVILEQCKAYNTHGTGFRTSSSADEFYFINCDAWNHTDSLEVEAPGNDGYGFGLWNTDNPTGRVYLRGCRAWNCGDDGFVMFSIGYVELDNCWSFSNGQMLGGGDGYKLGFSPSTTVNQILRRRVVNCIAAYNRHTGFNANDNADYPVQYMELYNNLAYCNYDFSNDYAPPARGIILYNTTDTDAEELKRVLRNNISFGNTVNAGDVDFDLDPGAVYTHSNNSWDGGATITSADFAALPTNYASGVAMLSGARQADGSLPDLGSYFKLTAGSDAIDAGVDVGLDYSGDAPDLGAYEYDVAGASTETDILTFFFAEEVTPAVIDTTNHTVAIAVDYSADMTGLTPMITVSPGATILPGSGIERSFITPVPYTVTAEDGMTEQEWTVTVTQAAAPPEGDPNTTIVRYRGKIVRR